MKDKTDKLAKLIQLSNKQKTITKRNIVENLDDPDSNHHEESWNKKQKLYDSPKHFGKRVLTRNSTVHHTKEQKIAKLKSDNASDELHVLQNGFSFIDSNKQVIEISNTCAFDATAQIFLCLYSDTEFFKGLKQSSNNPFFKFIKLLASFSDINDLYEERSQLMLNLYQKSKLITQETNITKLNAACTIAFILENCLPSPLTETRYCNTNTHTDRVRETFYLPFENVFSINQNTLKNLQNSIDFSGSNCPTCQRVRERNYFSNYGIVIADVQPNNNNYKIIWRGLSFERDHTFSIADEYSSPRPFYKLRQTWKYMGAI